MNATGPWVSVQERFPENGQHVLIRVNGDYDHGYPERVHVVFRRTSIATRVSYGWRTIENTAEDGISIFLGDEKVTHWAALYPPEGEPERAP